MDVERVMKPKRNLRTIPVKEGWEFGRRKEVEFEARENLPDWAEWLRREAQEGKVAWIHDLTGDTWCEVAIDLLVSKQLRKTPERNKKPMYKTTQGKLLTTPKQK